MTDHSPRRFFSLYSLLLTIVLLVSYSGNTFPADSYQASRVYAVADIHGAYDEFVNLLIAAELVDDNLAWRAQDAHLVVTGDMVDRGPRSRQVLDLLRKLREQAAVAGGMVHVLLGNHELLNIAGDVSYVSDQAFAEFAAQADDENARVRESLWLVWEDRYKSNRETFDGHYPPGFFAYLEAFSPEGEYGAWLLEQPWLVVINETAFLHAGLSTAPLGTEEAAVDLARYGNLWRDLVGPGLVQPRIGFFDHQDALRALSDNPGLSETQQEIVTELQALEQAPVFGRESLVWYRGNAACAAVLELDGVDEHLADLGASRAVFGHTPTASHLIQRRLDDRVILLDTGMLAERYYGQPSILSLDDDGLRGLYAAGGEWLELGEEMRDVGSRRGGLSDDELESWVQSADLVQTDQGSNNTYQVLTLEGNEHQMSVRWYPLKSSTADRAAAAYQLDKLLGLELVPVTVKGEVAGKDGALQYVPTGAVSEAERSSKDLPGAFLCDLGKQYELMYILDILLYNEGRTTDTIIYDPVTTRLLLVNNSNTFSRKSGAPPHLKGRALKLSDELRGRLSQLTADSASAHLGEFLSDMEITALLKRRDYILETAL